MIAIEGDLMFVEASGCRKLRDFNFLEACTGKCVESTPPLWEHDEPAIFVLMMVVFH